MPTPSTQRDVPRWHIEPREAIHSASECAVVDPVSPAAADAHKTRNQIIDRIAYSFYFFNLTDDKTSHTPRQRRRVPQPQPKRPPHQTVFLLSRLAAFRLAQFYNLQTSENVYCVHLHVCLKFHQLINHFWYQVNHRLNFCWPFVKTTDTTTTRHVNRVPR